MAKTSSRQDPGKSEHLLKLFDLLDEVVRRQQEFTGALNLTALADSAQVNVKTVKGYFCVDRSIRTRPQQWDKLYVVLEKLPYFAKRQPDDAASELLKQIKLAWEQSAPTATNRTVVAPVWAPTAPSARDAVSLPPPDLPLDAPARAALTGTLERTVADVPGLIARRYAGLRLGRIGANEDDRYENYVPLKLQPLGSEADDERPRQFDQLADLLASPRPMSDHATHTDSIWLLRGEPGAGKSTVLMDLELRHAYAACRAWREHPDARPEVCVRISLASMPSPERAADVDDWVESKWQALLRPLLEDGGTPPSLAELHRFARVRYLLDGLNEVHVAAGQQRRAINTFAAWSSEQIAARRPGPIFTVRRLNYVSFPQGAEFAITRVIDIEPWTEDHVRRYCALRFPDAGNLLWQAIDEHPQRHALILLFGNPFNLALQCALYKQRQGGRGPVAASRTQLMGRIGLLRLAAALQREESALAVPGLLYRADGMGDEERIADALTRHGALHEVPLRGRLLPVLEAVALDRHAHGCGTWARWAEDDTLTGVLHGDWEPAFKAAAALQMARLSPATGAGARAAEWQFSHQLWQEYLAASAMVRNEAAWRQVAVAAPKARPDVSGWELPSPEPVFWDQAVQLGVEMASPAMARVMLERLVAENPALAGRAALACVASVAPDMLARIKTTLLEGSRSTTQPRAEVRIEAGLLLGCLGDDLRFDEWQSPDGAPYRIPKASGWIAIPSARGHACIAFAPVTNAEFDCFVRDGGYGGLDDPEPPPWWEGEQATRWWRGEIESESRRTWWHLLRQHWGGPGWDDVRASQLSNWRQEDIARVIEPMMRCEQPAFDAAVARECAPRRSRQPDAWNVLRLRNPLQPVVGVCYWEAVAYCRWLSAAAAASGWRFRLPSEAEWEAVAGAVDARAGRQPGCAGAGSEASLNHLLLRARRPTPVGVFPASTTPEGVADLFGQVWEWTCGAHAEAGPTRGGSWDCHPDDCVANSRKAFQPSDREDDLGFRLVRSREVMKPQGAPISSSAEMG